MFQRIKGAIDSRIAEEQARQRASQNPPSRSSSAVRRSSGIADSPSRRAGRARERRDNAGPPGKGPDPADFEPEFVVGDDESLAGDGESRSGTPAPTTKQNVEKEDDGQDKPLADGAAEAEAKVETPRPSIELPTEVRVKLRKLDKLEARYQELLKAYRVAHARVTSIEPFEQSLRENTPLTSIADPGALLEYLNQITLKGDMVVDELKRVSTERDEYKKKLEEAEKSAKDAWDEVAGLKKQKEEQSETASLANGTPGRASMDISSASDDPLGTTQKNTSSPAASPKTRTPSLVSMFSPKLKSAKSPPPKEESEEFFSYDSEIPRLELELKEAREEVVDLKSQLTKVKGDLSVARESTEGMVQSLETATRELHTLRDGRDKHESEISDLRQKHDVELSDLREKHVGEIARLNDELKGSVDAANKTQALHKNEIESVKDEIEKTRLTASQQLEAQKAENEKAISSANEEKLQVEKKVGTLNGLVNTLREQLKDAEAKIGSLQTEIDERKAAADIKLEPQAEPKNEEQTSSEIPGDVPKHEEDTVKAEPQTADGATSSKKKNKKKKKGKGAAASNPDLLNQSPAPEKATPTTIDAKDGDSSDTIKNLQHELESLRSQLEEKDLAIDRMQKKLKDQDDLKEEIETLRDDLVNVGQEHVEAKDRVKALMAEKAAIEETVVGLEKDISELRVSMSSNVAGSEKAHSDLAAEFEELKTKATSLQTDLSVAQQLAASRFKDLTDLRDILQKVQPEMKSLKSELEETRGFKEKFSTKSNELRRLEARHEDLQSEVKGLRSTIAERDLEVKMLQQKISQETSNRLKAEEALGVAESDLRYSEAKKQEAVESNEKTARDLSKAQEELRTARARMDELEEQASQMARETSNLKEEIQLKTAQYSSAQNLMNSMRDQTSEMAMQMKEARERCESLEEELGESQRMLSERSREGETMRRLLADVEGRADSKVREFKERMDSAIEERDKAEDEASTVGRKRAREVEELKTRVRDAEKALKLVEEDKDELERLQKDWKKRREELEEQVERSTSEISDVRQAMGELRDALDDSERQMRELEKERTELRKTGEDAQGRIEKMQKTNRSMAEEIRAIKKPNSTVPSSRSSMDSRVGSPAPRNPSTIAKDAPPGPALDYVYLKNVLLQFLEQKDRNHQKQLIPVLGMLLHFDKKDEQKWMSAITAR